MKRVILLTALILLICSGYSFGDVPCKINYQGRLIKDNVPVNEPVNMEFKLYTQETEGEPIKTISINNVPVHNGLFRVVLDLEGINWAAGETIYLEVKAGTDTLTPREPIYAYPYAINSHLLEGSTKEYFLNVSGEEQTKYGPLNIMGNVGIGTSPNSKLDVSGAIKYSGSYTGTILYGNTNSTGTPTGDGFRVKYKAEFFGMDQDALVIEKTDGNQDSPDGGIAFVNTGQDGIEETALVIKGNGNVGIGTASPEAKLDVDGSLKIGGGTAIKKVQLGYIGTGTAGSAGSSGDVTFSAFSTIPLIFLTVDESGDDSGATSTRVIAKSTTGFSWNSWIGNAQHAADGIFWIAVEIE